MAGRSAPTRRLPENDPTIAYVQADGLVSVFHFASASYYLQCRVRCLLLYF